MQNEESGPWGRFRKIVRAAAAYFFLPSAPNWLR